MTATPSDAEAMYRLYRTPDGVKVVAAQWFDRGDYDEDRWVEGWDKAYDTEEEAEGALAALPVPGLDYNNVNRARNGFDLDRGLTVETGVRALAANGAVSPDAVAVAAREGLVERPRTVNVRIRVHHDVHYSEQSTAIAEVWNPDALSWSLAASYSPGQWAEFTNPLDDATEMLYHAADELEARVRALLALS